MIDIIFSDTTFGIKEDYQFIEKLLKKDKQTILFTPNVNYISNDIMRPDCYYVADINKGIHKFCDLTMKSLRKAHNLRKLYVGGFFE